MKWTREQLEDIQRYGVCRVCGWPRKARMIKRPEFGQSGPMTFAYGIYCTNDMGHSEP